MEDPNTMTPLERFAEIADIAPVVYGTNQWRTQFAADHGIRPLQLSRWKDSGAPVWALVTMRQAQSLAHYNSLKSQIAGLLAAMATSPKP